MQQNGEGGDVMVVVVNVLYVCRGYFSLFSLDQICSLCPLLCKEVEKQQKKNKTKQKNKNFVSELFGKSGVCTKLWHTQPRGNFTTPNNLSQKK